MKKVLAAIVTFIFSVCLITATVATASAASVKKVSGFKASVKPVEVTLSWSKTSGAKGYEIQQKSGKKWKTVATIKKQKTTSYTVKKLKNGTTYQFRIRAVNGKKKGSYVTVKAKTGVQTIADVKAASASLTSVKLSWTKANVTGYEIQKKDGKKWKTVTKIKKSKTTSYTVKSLPAGKTTTFRIRGYVSGSAKTFYGSYTEVKGKTAVPAMSTVSVKSVTSSSATVGWSKVSGATGYEVQKYVSGKWVAAHSKTLSSKTTSLTVKDLSALTSYKIRVRAVQKSGKTNYYNSWKTITAKTKIGSASSVKVSDLKPTFVKISWKAAGGAAGYTVNYNGTKVNVKTNSATLSIKAGTQYKVTVTPYNGSTVGTATSAVSFTSPCAKVGGLKASAVTESAITVAWTKPAGAASYQLQYSKNGGSWSSAVSLTATSYQLKNLEANTKYSFRVRALNKNGSTTQYGEYSSAFSATTKGVKSASDTLSWAAVSGASNYTVQYFDTEAIGWKALASKITATSYKNAEISKDASRIFRVVAYDKGGKTLYTSNCVTGKLATVSLTVSGDVVSASWSKVSGAASYALKIKSRGMTDGGATVISTTGTSAKSSILAPGLSYDVTLVAVIGGKETAVASFAVKTSALTLGSSDKEKNAQLLYLVEAINRSKFDDTRIITLRSTPYNLTQVKYVDFGIQGANEGNKLAVAAKTAAAHALLKLLFGDPDDIKGNCEMKDGFLKCKDAAAIDAVFAEKDANGNIIEKMSEQEVGGRQRIYSFLDGEYGSYKLEDLIQPIETKDGLAYLYNSSNPSAWKNGFSKLETTKTENGYKVVATLKAETSPKYHDGFISGASATNMGDMGMGDMGSAKLDSYVGQTEIVAEIDEECRLTSYSIVSPYRYDMKVEVSLVSEMNMADGDGDEAINDALGGIMKLFDDVVIEMNTKVEGRQEYTYTFSRTK